MTRVFLILQIGVAATLVSACEPAATEAGYTTEPDINAADSDVDERRDAVRGALR